MVYEYTDKEILILSDVVRSLMDKNIKAGYEKNNPLKSSQYWRLNDSFWWLNLVLGDDIQISHLAGDKYYSIKTKNGSASFYIDIDRFERVLSAQSIIIDGEKNISLVELVVLAVLCKIEEPNRMMDVLRLVNNSGLRKLIQKSDKMSNIKKHVSDYTDKEISILGNIIRLVMDENIQIYYENVEPMKVSRLWRLKDSLWWLNIGLGKDGQIRRISETGACSVKIQNEEMVAEIDKSMFEELLRSPLSTSVLDDFYGPISDTYLVLLAVIHKIDNPKKVIETLRLIKNPDLCSLVQKSIEKTKKHPVLDMLITPKGR